MIRLLLLRFAREALRKSTNSFAVNIIYNLIKSILPLLISIFILVATRKFKELNQLIEENKNL
jgi:prolipoprotein diacylglyceryltransferase